MAEGTSDQLRRRLGELLQRRPTHSDDSWKDSMMKANRIKALVDCHKVALRRKKALGFSSRFTGSVSDSDMKALSLGFEDTQPPEHDGGRGLPKRGIKSMVR